MISDVLFRDLCRRGSFLADDWTAAFFAEWARFENVPAWINNPLATTEPAPDLRVDTDIGFGPGKWNTANAYGVGIYKSPVAGAEATWRTLSNGYYPAVVEAVRAHDLSNNRQLVAAQLRTWGTTGFADAIAAGWAPPHTGVKPDRLRELELKVQYLEHWQTATNLAVLQRLTDLAAAGDDLLAAAAAWNAALHRAAAPDSYPR